jgi:hypothetical protein
MQIGCVVGFLLSIAWFFSMDFDLFLAYKGEMNSKEIALV